MYNRREQRDLRSNINRAVPYDSYIPIVITNPLTNEPLTIYNQNPATVGGQDNILTELVEAGQQLQRRRDLVPSVGSVAGPSSRAATTTARISAASPPAS